MKKIKKLLKMSFYDLWILRRINKYKRRSKRIISQYQSENSVQKLHIGCGGNLMSGWLNSDIFPDTIMTAYLDASQTFPIADNTFDYVYSEHVFEHLNFQAQLNYLKESFRILRPGGKIRIATPDFNFLIHLASNETSTVEKEYLEWNFNHFLPAINAELKDNRDLEVYVINNYFRDWGHQLIHNKESLRHLINLTGFENVYELAVSESGDKCLQNIERHAEMITEEFNKLETMIFEAEKLTTA